MTKVSNLLLDEEADYLIEKAKESGFKRSTVIGSEENELSKKELHQHLF